MPDAGLSAAIGRAFHAFALPYQADSALIVDVATQFGLDPAVPAALFMHEERCADHRGAYPRRLVASGQWPERYSDLFICRDVPIECSRRIRGGAAVSIIVTVWEDQSLSIQPVATSAVPVSPPAVKAAAAPTTSAPPAPAVATPAQRPDAVTLSKSVQLAATSAARSAIVRAASSHASAPPTTTSGYVMKVRAALARGSGQSVSQIMASLGIPQAEQQQVAMALGVAPKSAPQG